MRLRLFAETNAPRPEAGVTLTPIVPRQIGPGQSRNRRHMLEDRMGYLLFNRAI